MKRAPIESKRSIVDIERKHKMWNSQQQQHRQRWRRRSEMYCKSTRIESMFMWICSICSAFCKCIDRSFLFRRRFVSFSFPFLFSAFPYPFEMGFLRRCPYYLNLSLICICSQLISHRFILNSLKVFVCCRIIILQFDNRSRFLLGIACLDYCKKKMHV